MVVHSGTWHRMCILGGASSLSGGEVICSFENRNERQGGEDMVSAGISEAVTSISASAIQDLMQAIANMLNRCEAYDQNKGIFFARDGDLYDLTTYTDSDELYEFKWNNPDILLKSLGLVYVGKGN